eukprot:g5491.t1
MCSSMSDKKYEQLLRKMSRSKTLKDYLRCASLLDEYLGKKRGSIPLPILKLSKQLSEARKAICYTRGDERNAKSAKMGRRRIAFEAPSPLTPRRITFASVTSSSATETPVPVRSVINREIGTYPDWMQDLFQGGKNTHVVDSDVAAAGGGATVVVSGDSNECKNDATTTRSPTKGKDVLESLLRVLCVANHSGIDDELFFSQNFTGRNVEAEAVAENTAQTIRSYFSLPSLASSSPSVDAVSRSALLNELRRSFGTSALCMSGGAACGYYHMGVVRALVRRDLLPKVLSGSSAGAVVAAAVCCAASEEELDALVNPSIYRKCTPCKAGKMIGLLRLLRTGSYLSEKDAWESAKGMLGKDPNITFLEAYRRTGRVLCISVYNGEHHSEVLSHVTSPNVCIYSAVVASAAIPMLLPPQTLVQKLPDGTLAPWKELGEKWIDGGLEGDLPIVRLQQSFNVKYIIVSQVEPHLTPFFFFHSGSAGNPTRHRNGRGWRSGFVLSFLEHALKTDMKRHLQLLRDFDLFPRFFGHDLSAAFLQDALGTVTVLAPLTWWDYVRLLDDPGSSSTMSHYLDSGARQTWPKLHMIRCRTVVERALEEAAVIARESDKKGRAGAGCRADFPRSGALAGTS